MKQKIEEKTKELQQIIEAIKVGRNKITQLEQAGFMVQGELRLLKELIAEAEKGKSKKDDKDTKK